MTVKEAYRKLSELRDQGFDDVELGAYAPGIDVEFAVTEIEDDDGPVVKLGLHRRSI
jgi:hypothetical protein